MLHNRHGIDLMQKEAFELWLFDHFFLGDAFDSETSRGGGRFGSQENMTETAFT